MSHHPKHRQEQPKSPFSPVRFGIAAAVLGALIVGFILWAASPTPVAPTPVPVQVPDNESLNHILVAQAYCDHMPPWSDDPKRRHVVVSARPEVIIDAVVVYYNHEVLTSFIRLGDLSKGDHTVVHLRNAFNEGMHGARLAVTVRYVVKGVKFETLLHCDVEVTN